EAQKEAYGDGLDPDALHPYMWTWKPHYYDPDYSFYNFPYAFGLLLAKGLYAMYLEDPSFASRYEQLLAYTGQADLEDVALTVGINLQNPSFWEGSMAVLKEDADRFASLIKARLDGEETQ
ncbi:MAG: M3 family oligoendopeptidase, partial [bacterium]